MYHKQQNKNNFNAFLGDFYMYKEDLAAPFLKEIFSIKSISYSVGQEICQRFKRISNFIAKNMYCASCRDSNPNHTEMKK